MSKHTFTIEIEIEHESGPRISADALPAELASALDSEMPIALWCEPETADEETGYRVKATSVRAVV